MAKKTDEYISHAVPIEISATSRSSIKIKDNFYTVEATEKRSILDADGVNMDLEWKMLFDAVNEVIDNQCQDIFDSFK